MIRGLTGLRAAVTGAARGIGRATALRLAELGADVAVLDINLRPTAEGHRDDAEQTTTAIERLGRRTVGEQVDLTDERAAHSAIHRIVREWDGLDLLVTIAGGAITPYERSAPSAIPAADIRTCLDVNLMTTVYACQAAAPVLVRSAEHGLPAAIVTMSSLSAGGVLPGGMLSGYALSKAAVAHYTRSLAEELGPLGVRVNAVAPGYVMTARIRANSAVTGFADKAADSALRRLAEPGDIADAVAYLASPMAGYITGQVLPVDGATRLN